MLDDYPSDKPATEDSRVGAMRRFVELTEAIDVNQERRREVESHLAQLRSEREEVRQFLREAILTPSEGATEPTPTRGF